jgi:hypothetical protein
MKATLLSIAILIICLTLTVNVRMASAQVPAGPYYTVTTIYMKQPTDGRNSERDSVLKEYFTKVIMKNELIVHEWSMQHYYTDDSREFFIIDQYKSWDDIQKASTRNTELEKQAWPDQKQRDALFAKFEKYFGDHSDRIVTGFPEMIK